MIQLETKIDFDDLLIVPTNQSEINSRKKEVNVYDDNGMLPIFTAPMDTVISLDNLNIFNNNNIYSIIPRTIKTDNYINNWVAIGLNDFEMFLDSNINLNLNYKILIDIANGNMKKLHLLIKKSKDILGEKLSLMVGNIANPETYKIISELGVDFARVGVGNGGACLTSKNVGVGYPMASLIKECYDISCTLDNPTKIVADGGIKEYSDIIKALGLGADMVMLGSIFNKSLESAGETYKANIKHENWTEPGELVNQYSDETKNAYLNGARFYKKFRGMSTKDVQKKLGNKKLTTSEGVTRINPVEYTLEGWVENFSHYLASAMSYSGAKTLNDFIGKANFVKISTASFNRFNK